jgi:PAS domain S-box-containing protein
MAEKNGDTDVIDRYKTIFAVTSVGIGITDEMGRIVECNDAFTAMLGYSGDELYGRSIQEFNHPDDVLREESIVLGLTEQAPRTRLEKRFVKKDGSILWTDLTVSAVFQEDLPPYYVGILTDITESITGRSTIEQLNKHLEAALRGGNMAWWEMELPSGKVIFNERKATILGYRPEKFTHYTDFMDLVHPDDYDATMEAFQKHLDGSAETYTCEYRIRNAAGEYVWFRDLGKITSRENGIITLTGIVTEITEQRRIRSDLEAANRRFLTILKYINVGIIVIARDSQEILYVNPYMQSFYPDPLEHKLCTQVFGYKEDLCPQCPVFNTSEKTEKADHQFIISEYHLPEIEKYFLMQISPIRWVDKQEAALLILTDITPMKEVEQLKDDIGRITRHDLKNPLTGILGGVELLLAETDDALTEEQKEYIGIIEESGKRMLAMIDESMGLYKMEKGLYKVQHEEIDLEELLKNIVKEHRSFIDGRKIDVTFERTPSSEGNEDPINAKGEQLLCYSLFSNIFRNALDASKTNDPVRISLGKDKGDWVYVSVWNRKEIPKEIRQNFGRKYSTWGKSRGTGLGVYSARLMTETQGGTFSWDSSKEAGTTIRITLPASG